MSRYSTLDALVRQVCRIEAWAGGVAAVVRVLAPPDLDLPRLRAALERRLARGRTTPPELEFEVGGCVLPRLVAVDVQAARTW